MLVQNVRDIDRKVCKINQNMLDIDQTVYKIDRIGAMLIEICASINNIT